MSIYVVPRSTTRLVASPAEAEALTGLLAEGESLISDGPLPLEPAGLLLKLKLNVLARPKVTKAPKSPRR